jgi:hypothetical protein
VCTAISRAEQRRATLKGVRPQDAIVIVAEIILVLIVAIVLILRCPCCLVRRKVVSLHTNQRQGR